MMHLEAPQTTSTQKKYSRISSTPLGLLLVPEFASPRHVGQYKSPSFHTDLHDLWTLEAHPRNGTHSRSRTPEIEVVMVVHPLRPPPSPIFFFSSLQASCNPMTTRVNTSSRNPVENKCLTMIPQEVGGPRERLPRAQGTWSNCLET